MPPQDKALRPLVICGPSGVGKGTLINLLFKEFPEHFGFSVSHTTRNPRPGTHRARIPHHVHAGAEARRGLWIDREPGESVKAQVMSSQSHVLSRGPLPTTPLYVRVCLLLGEVHGVHYNFTSKEAMSAAIDEGRFLEFAQVHTNLYGTR